MRKRVIQVGTGGFGKTWCRDILPACVQDGLIDVVAAVDVNPDALENARTYLGLRPDQCFNSFAEAFATVDADFCTIVVPPSFHEEVVDAALVHNLHILSEKPIADSLEVSIRIVEKVRLRGRHMAVTMSHSHDQDKQSFLKAVRRHGQLDYLVARVTNDARAFGSWGRYRHEMPDPVLNETAYHHLDAIRALAGAPCESVFAQSWNPEWGAFAGDSQAHVMMQFENGVHAFYEGAMSNAVGLNGSETMYLRAECQSATLTLNHRELRRFGHKPGHSFKTQRESEGELLPLLQQPYWSHQRIICQFIDWLNGGDPAEANAEDNLQTAALVFAAIESSHTKQLVYVQEYLERVRREVRLSFQV